MAKIIRIMAQFRPVSLLTPLLFSAEPCFWQINLSQANLNAQVFKKYGDIAILIFGAIFTSVI